jgi:hypothetical protein
MKNVLLGVALVSASISSAFAAVPVDVTTAITDGKADTVTVATGFVVMVLVVKVLHMLKRG